MQMSHDLLSWLSVGSILLGGLWWVIAGLKDELKISNSITDNHEIRFTKLETWKHDKWEMKLNNIKRIVVTSSGVFGFFGVVINASQFNLTTDIDYIFG